jgi:prepilin-type N-terminal cleavage/methylation domain-containing protein
LRLAICDCRTIQSPKSKIANSRAGLTLVEVLLALVILGIGLSGLIATASKCLSVAKKARNYETARELLARVDIEKPIQLEKKIEDAEGSGSFDAPYQGYAWKREIELVGLEEDCLYRVNTRVSWAEHGQNAWEELVTYVYAPGEKKGSVAKPAAN